MKKLISLLLLCSTISAQKNVYVEYGVAILDEKDSFPINSPYREMFQRAMDNAPNLTFSLIINEKASKFFDNSNLIINDDNYSYRGNLALACFSGVSYQFKNKILSECSMIGKEFLVQNEIKKNWFLTNETKMIDNYLCYKATNIYRVEWKEGNKVFNHPVTAWYCPKLPYPHGPNGYGNLPGLILELQVRNVVYGVKKIDLNSDLNFDTAFVATKKIITEEELNAKLKEDRER